MINRLWLALLFLLPLAGWAQRADTLTVPSHALASLPLADSIAMAHLNHDSMQCLAVSPSLQVDSIISFSKKFIGIPYRYGGKTTQGFDCSGFMVFVFKNFGVELPPSSRSQALIGKKVPADSIQKGDLVFFKGRNPKSQVIGHVAMVVQVSDTNDIQFIHSTRHGLRLDWLSEEPYYKKRFLASRRLTLPQAN